MAEAAYASSADVIVEAVNSFLPPKRVTVAEHAAANRWLANAGGGYVGRWRHDFVPYLVEPMECLTSSEYLTVAIVGPGQSAKTSAAENWFLHSVDTDPADMLWYMQTDDGLEAYVKGRINPMIESHDAMRLKQGLKPVDDSLHFKRFRSMKIEFLSATESNLINKSAPRIVADEIDAYPKSLGDVKTLLDVRRQTFGRQSKLLAMSHPDLARGLNPDRDWSAGIMAIYADSTRCLWYWPCPHCGGYSSPAPIASRYMPIEYPVDGTLDDIEAGAFLSCPCNGCIIADIERPRMNACGRWVGDGQEISVDGVLTGRRVVRNSAGYWVVGAMSPFIIGGIGGLARARVKAQREREVSGEDETLRQVIVKQWGFPYAPPRAVGSIDANDLVDRVEERLTLGTVPEGVRFLTIAVDCQANHFEVLVRGWGTNSESWIIATEKIKADPATSAEDWDKLFLLPAKVFPLADASGRGMVARAMGVDSGGLPGVTQQAYAAWKRARAKRKTRLFGKIAGRDAWSVILLKGASGINAPKLQVTYPDTSRKANVVSGAGEVPLGVFNPNSFKDDLSGQLRCAEPGDWYVHFPAALKSKEAPHVWFEQATSEQRLPNGRYEKINPSAHNEALDLLVMSHVVAHLHGLPRIKWQKPPAWADEFDKNSLVSVTGPANAASSADAPAALGVAPVGPVTPSAPSAPGVVVTAPASGAKSLSDRLA